MRMITLSAPGFRVLVTQHYPEFGREVAVFDLVLNQNEKTTQTDYLIALLFLSACWSASFTAPTVGGSSIGLFEKRQGKSSVPS
jgi:hypothetical protein